MEPIWLSLKWRSRLTHLRRIRSCFWSVRWPPIQAGLGGTNNRAGGACRQPTHVQLGIQWNRGSTRGIPGVLARGENLKAYGVVLKQRATSSGAASDLRPRHYPSAGRQVRRVPANVPCYNGAPGLAEAISSIRARTRQVDEIIVVTDCSSDGPYQIAEDTTRPSFEIPRTRARVTLGMLGSSTHVETSARGSMPMTYGCFITLRRLRRFSCGTHGRLGRLLVSSNSVHVINLASTTYLLGALESVLASVLRLAPHDHWLHRESNGSAGRRPVQRAGAVLRRLRPVASALARSHLRVHP